MADKNNDHRSQVRHQEFPDSQIKEYNYALHILPGQSSLLAGYRDEFVSGTTDFAEVYYNFLFDNPDIANVLYNHEKGGGDVGQLVRQQLENMLASIIGDADQVRENDLFSSGKEMYNHNFRQVWIIANYNLLLNYLGDLINTLNLASREQHLLVAAVNTVLLRDMGLTLEGFTQASRDALNKELSHVVDDLGTVEDLLSGIPHYVWSVNIKSNKVVYANYPLHSLYSNALEAPIPCMQDAGEADQQQLMSVWQNAVSGNQSFAEVKMTLAGCDEHWYRLSLYPSFNRLGNPVLMHCVLEDINHQISERMQLE